MGAPELLSKGNPVLTHHTFMVTLVAVLSYGQCPRILSLAQAVRDPICLDINLKALGIARRSQLSSSDFPHEIY